MARPEVFLETESSDGRKVEVGNLTETGELTVNGDPVVTRSRFSLSRPQQWAAFITVISAGLVGFYARLQIIGWFKADRF